MTGLCYSLRESMCVYVCDGFSSVHRFYAEYTSRKKLLEKSELKYNYVQMPDNVEVLDSAHMRAPVTGDPHHVGSRQLA